MGIVSKKIRNSAKGEECTLRIPGICNFDPDTTVFCHLPSKASGIGQKGNDYCGVYGCHNCHSVLDRRHWHQPFEDERWEQIHRAWEETLSRLIEKGLIIIK